MPTKQKTQAAVLPSFEVYGRYDNANYGAHALRFTDAADNSFYFSYKTLVAFHVPGKPPVVHQNDWGTTTGKHLNAIDGGAKKTRLNDSDFKAAFFAAFNRKDA